MKLCQEARLPAQLGPRSPSLLSFWLLLLPLWLLGWPISSRPLLPLWVLPLGSCWYRLLVLLLLLLAGSSCHQLLRRWMRRLLPATCSHGCTNAAAVRCRRRCAAIGGAHAARV